MVHPHVFFKSIIPKDSWWDLQTSILTNRVHFHLGCVPAWMLGRSCPANLPMKELSSLFSQCPWSCNSGPNCYQDVAMWIACAYNHIFAVVVLCLLNPNLVSSALVIAHFCFSPPTYCPSIWCFTNHMFFEFTRMAPHLQFFSTALKLCKWWLQFDEFH